MAGTLTPGSAGVSTAQLRDLDQLLAALKTGLGAEWANTLVLVATEFGRTVHPNGTGGTDHGQASAAMLLGGAVRGGTVLADWPGLSQAALYEGRDLRPTADLDALIGAALAQHYRDRAIASDAGPVPGQPWNGVWTAANPRLTERSPLLDVAQPPVTPTAFDPRHPA